MGRSSGHFELAQQHDGTSVKTMSRFLRGLSVCLVLASICGLPLADPANAVPGEVSGLKLFAAGGNDADIDLNSLGHVVTRLPSGGLLAFADVSKRTPLGGGENLVLERNRVQIRKYAASGKRDTKFARSEIGKGVLVGRKTEIFDFMRIFRYNASTYLAWATTEGSLTRSSAGQWARSILIAFDARTGRLVRTFGANGILTYGERSSIRFETSRAFDTQLVRGGSILTCGDREGVSLAGTGGPPGRAFKQPFIVRSIAGQDQGPFLASGSEVIPFVPTESRRAKSCRKLMQDVSGRVVVAGYLGDNIDFDERALWVSAYSAEGVLDPSFGSGGEQVLNLPAAQKFDLTVSDLKSDALGRIYVAGSSSSRAHQGFVVRLTPEGQLDSSFGSNGLKWIPTFGDIDLAILNDGTLFLSGIEKSGIPGAAWVTPNGRWDKNFLGTGSHLYREAESGKFYALAAGHSARLWGWGPLPQKKCACRQVGEVAMSNHVVLDSSISSIRRESKNKMRVSGFASSPIGSPQVQVGIGTVAQAPRKWLSARGNYSWSKTMTLPSGIGSNARVYARAFSATESFETRFSTSDRNKLRVPRLR